MTHTDMAGVGFQQIRVILGSVLAAEVRMVHQEKRNRREYTDMNEGSRLSSEFRAFQGQLQHSSGHSHLYDPFEALVSKLASYRKSGLCLDLDLADSILGTVDVLVTEGGVGRRPWEGQWELYFEKCLRDGVLLLREFGRFPNAQERCPPGFCNRFLDLFLFMDHFDREYSERDARWARHFRALAGIAAEMFSLVADRQARISELTLEHPDDAIFTHLLTAFAKSGSSTARSLLNKYSSDDEQWVRDLAETLIRKYF